MARSGDAVGLAGLEDYYWQLAGESDDSNELMLIGMMCDRIEVRQEPPGGDLVIELERRVGPGRDAKQ